MPELDIGNRFICFLKISTYVNKGIAKVQISTEIGVHVEGPTYEIWNSPTMDPKETQKKHLPGNEMETLP